MNKKKCIVWCAELNDLNGQNIVTTEVLNIFKKNYEFNLYQYKTGFNFFIFFYFSNLLALYREIIFSKNDFVYLVCSRSSFGFLRDIPILILSKFGCRLIVHVHGSDFLNLFENKIFNKLVKLLYLNCEIIVPSKHMIKGLNKLNFKKLTVCENFVSNNILDFKEEKNLLTKHEKHKFKILWNSNIISSKGFFETFEAIALLNKSNFEIEFIILGRFIQDSELSFEEIKKKFNNIKNKKWVFPLNQVSRLEYRKLILSANLIILPSTYPSECQPLAIIEAMIYAKHVIINDTKALRNTVGNYPALLTKRNKYKIAESIRYCIEKDKISLVSRKRGAEEARKRFSQKRFCNNFFKIL